MLVIARCAQARVAQFALRKKHLAHDLGDAQVAVEALLRGGAERAIHRTADLRGDAQRAAVGLGDVHHLDALHAVHAQHPFARAVRRSLLLDDFRHRDRGRLGELRAKLLREVRHRGEVRDTAPVQPFHQLTRAERLRAKALGDERFEFRAR